MDSSDWNGLLPGAGENFDTGQQYTSGYQNGMMNPQTLQALQAMGWTGGNPLVQSGDVGNGAEGGGQNQTPQGVQTTFTPEFKQWMQANGITSETVQDAGNWVQSFKGPGGQQIGAPTITEAGMGTDFIKNAALMVAGGASLGAGLGAVAGGAGAAGAGGAAAEAGAAGGLSDLGLSAADMSTLGGFSADASALGGDAALGGGFGSGLGGFEGADFAGMGATGGLSAEGAPAFGGLSGGFGGGFGVGSSGYGELLSKLFNPQNASQASTLAKLLGGQGGNSGGVGQALAAALAGAFAKSGSGSIGSPNYGGAADSSALSGRTDQYTPWGSSVWKQTGVDAQGHPTYSQTTSLNAQGQSNLNAAQAAQGKAIGNLGMDQSAQIQQAQDAAYHKQTALLDPQYQQGQQALTSSLANQGIGIGSEAYNNATDNFARQKDYAYGNARDSAIGIGNQMQQQLFGQNMTAATGLNGAVQTPNFMQTPQQTNYLGAAALQGQGNLNQYNANTGANNSFNNGLFNLAGSVLSNPNWTSLIGDFFKPGP